MADDPALAAQRKLEAALEASGAPDPRVYYRDALRTLRERDPVAYDELVAYYRDELVPAVAGGGTEPLAAWRAYGRLLAERVAPGRTVSVDPTGRAEPYEEPPPPDRLVLHLPERANQRALVVALPLAPTPAQSATLDLLVAGRQRLPDA
ncbi:MAG: hypothetical protein D6701_05320 [Gemmatimonadetes bacterium]|nr:MAG: hypothetical protein D6701_05320 [Gemmatimonadota bacterium]